MRISNIPRPKTDTAYIVGTGPSMRCMPLGWFDDKFTIGLNAAYKYLPCTLSITVHPELLVEYRATVPLHPQRTQWVVKKKPPMENLELSDPNYFVFHTSYDIKAVCERPADTLYLGEGVQTSAMDLAARTGCKTIILVGCDAAALGGDYHGHDQHVRFLGLEPKDQYALYRQRTAEVRAELRKLGVSVMTLSPFIGATGAEEDYARLSKELKLDKLPPPKDTSPYKREKPKTNHDRK